MRHRFEYFLVKSIELAVRPLPLRVVRRLGEALGLMFYLVDRIHRPQLQQSVESLETAGAHLFGIVMNKVARREAAAYGYGSGYTSYAPRQRSAPVPAKRRWDVDDTLAVGQWPRNGHKARAGRAH